MARMMILFPLQCLRALEPTCTSKSIQKTNSITRKQSMTSGLASALITDPSQASRYFRLARLTISF
eukprot:109850-Pyramimonas_sp.AAC.1